MTCIMVAKTSSFGPKLVPYIFGGVALFAHNPQAKTPVDFGNEWVDLKASSYRRTRATYAKPYSLVNLAVPVGIGVRYRLSESLIQLPKSVYATPFQIISMMLAVIILILMT